MNKSRSSVLLCLLAVASGVWGPGCPQPFVPGRPSPVFVLDTELLTPPAIGTEPAYVPALWFDLDPADAAAGRAAGFFLTVTANSPDLVQMRLDGLPLTKMSRPTTEQCSSVFDCEVLDARVLSALRSGSAVYWPADDSGSELLSRPTLPSYRFAVAVPEPLLDDLTRLSVFTWSADDGTAIGGDTIELVQGFVYLGAIGDSLMWGNGLRHEDKIPAQLARLIEADTGLKVICQLEAVSGTPIVASANDSVCQWNCYGEIPKAITSIPFQAQLLERPELLDVILVNGCGSDMGAAVPMDFDQAIVELPAIADTYCHGAMLEMIRELRSLSPHARIVVLGYYRAVSEESKYPASTAWLEALALPPLNLPIVNREEAILVSGILEEVTRDSLTAAVDAANAESQGDPMVAFAAPLFGPANCIFAPDAWLWGLTNNGNLAVHIKLDLELKVFPEDPLFNFRQTACFHEDARAYPLGCLYSSLGHPNATGARSYAEEILEALRELGMFGAAGEER